MRAVFVSWLTLAALALPAAAQKPAAGKKPATTPAGAPAAAPAEAAPADPVLAGDVTALRTWLQDYRVGAVRFVKDGVVDDAAVATLDQRMQKVAQWNTLPAAQLLFELATVEPKPGGGAKAGGGDNAVELVDFQRELQPWRVQAMANQHLRTMTGDGILPWLLGKLAAPGLRAQTKNKDQVEAAATLRVLGGHPSIEAQLELMKACRSMPTELRVQAVNAMAKDPTLDLVPTLVELLKDAEPNVRIAAANAIGAALAPHVDETLGKKPDAAVAKTQADANARLEELLVRDQTWQVRSAAAFGLAVQKCKCVIPQLIKGLEAELARKKDPWAMDVRLHKILEGLTGQSVARGSIEPWKQFWAKEGASFAVRTLADQKAQKPKESRYEKFFDLEVESDRVLFVVDFSGSMAEPAKITGATTNAQPTATGTKAQLVVQELKRLIMSLPDGALVNLVVFSDTVRIWRQEGGRPALVKLDDTARDDLLGNFLDTLRPNGPTNLYDALHAALDFGGRGLHDKYYAAGFDTMYVITDGAPTVGAVVDKEEIRRRVRETNRLRRIAIHCVTFGAKNDTDFLGPLAEENGGRHIHVE